MFAASTDAKSYLMETLGGAETVKGMGIERPVRLRWERKVRQGAGKQYQAQSFHILVGLVSQVLNAATTIAVLWVGATLVLERELTIGQLIAFNAFMGSVLAPVMGLVALWSQLNDAGVAMERLGDVLDLEPEQKPQDVLSRVMLPDLQGEIRFEGVYFRYGGEDTPTCSRTSASTCGRARWWPSWAAAAPARPRWPSCWWASTSRAKDRCRWMATTST